MFFVQNMCLNAINRLKSNQKLFSLIVKKGRLKTCHQLIGNNQIFRYFNNKSYDWLKNRGIFHSNFPEISDINDLLSSKQTIYAGFDATNDSLHVGNLLVMTSLLQLQRLGHRVVVVIGDSTARIGDPSGKTHDRPLIDEDLVMRYASSIETTVKQIFDNHEKHFWRTRGRNDRLEELIICRNSQWFSDKNVIDFMSSFGRYLRIATMIGKTIRERLDTTGLCLSEFSYQLFQSYDWYYLHQRYGSQIQVGGVDQLINIHCGHDLIKRLTNKQTYGLFVPLLTNSKGHKLGKTEEKALYLNSDRTSAYSFYQFFQRLTDTEIHDYMKRFSFRSDAEIEQMFQKQLRNPKPWYLQTKLAEEVTLLVHGEAGLSSAKRTTEALFKKDVQLLSQLSDSEIDDVFEGAPKTTLLFSDEMTALDIAMKAQCFQNEWDALKAIKGGGFYINYTKVSSPQQIFSQRDILQNSLTLVSIGKRRHHIVKWF